MKKLKIESSILNAVGYDIASKKLYVEFNSGLMYAYKKVPATVVMAMLMAESHGKYFNENIRDSYKFNTKNKWPEI